MDLQPNKTDGIYLPITNTRISASEWNQLVGSCMEFITAAGFTPDAADNEQFLNAFKAIAASLELVGANTNLSNVTSTGSSTASGWAMPSSTASAVSLSTSSSNTMTSAGWVIVGAHSDNIGSVNLQIGNTIHKVCSSYTGGNAQSFNYYPVYTGETVNISTDGTGTIDVYVFVPCAGVN